MANFYYDDNGNPIPFNQPNYNGNYSNNNAANQNQNPNLMFHAPEEAFPQTRQRGPFPVNFQNNTLARDTESVILGVIFKYQKEISDFLCHKYDQKISQIEQRINQSENNARNNRNQQAQQERPDRKDRTDIMEKHIRENYDELLTLKTELSKKADISALMKLQNDLNTLVSLLKKKQVIND